MMTTRQKTWRVSDEFWALVAPLVPRPERSTEKHYRRRPGGGRKPLDCRQVLEAILYVLRTGTAWKALPKDLYGSASSIHAYFRIWEKGGFFDTLWRKGLAEHDDMAGIAWQWHQVHTPSIAGSDFKAYHTGGKPYLPTTIIQKAWRPVIVRRESWRRSTDIAAG